MISTLLAVFSSFARLIMSDPTKERTFIAVKPDGVQRGLVGEIMKRFERRGYKMVACKMMHASKEHLGKHYSALANKPFFNDLVAYMHSGPVVAMASKEHLKKHYADLSSKPFFDGLVNYMNSGPVVAMVWEGRNVVAMGRKLLGATKPDDSAPGTIRGDFCIDVGRNICHGSDAVESAKREIDLWFEPKELVQWDSCEKSWVYE